MLFEKRVLVESSKKLPFDSEKEPVGRTLSFDISCSGMLNQENRARLANSVGIFVNPAVTTEPRQVVLGCIAQLFRKTRTKLVGMLQKVTL